METAIFLEVSPRILRLLSAIGLGMLILYEVFISESKLALMDKYVWTHKELDSSLNISVVAQEKKGIQLNEDK